MHGRPAVFSRPYPTNGTSRFKWCRMQVVDPHIHLWNLETGRYPWLQAPAKTFMGDYKALAKTHEVREFLEDADGIEVLKVVHVEASHDPADPLARPTPRDGRTPV